MLAASPIDWGLGEGPAIKILAMCMLSVIECNFPKGCLNPKCPKISERTSVFNGSYTGYSVENLLPWVLPLRPITGCLGCLISLWIVFSQG